ncbi:MAG: hypothetical protein WCA45_00220, partial [Thiobacillaceae bacterium]
SLLMFVEQLAQINPEQAGKGEARRPSGKRVSKKLAAANRARAKSTSTSQRIDDALDALERLRA